MAEVHRAFLEAGSDIIETNTFNGQTISQSDYDLEKSVYDINYHGSRIARQEADAMSKKDGTWRLVAGAVGPTNRTTSISPKVEDPGFRNTDYLEIKDCYKEQIKALIEGGCHIILIETIFDSLNSRAGVFAYKEFYEENPHLRPLPLFISGTIIDMAGRTLSG